MTRAPDPIEILSFPEPGDDSKLRLVDREEDLGENDQCQYGDDDCGYEYSCHD